jgi:hypothetical protein
MGILERIHRMSAYSRPRLKPSLDIERSGVGKFTVSAPIGNRIAPQHLLDPFNIKSSRSDQDLAVLPADLKITIIDADQMAGAPMVTGPNKMSAGGGLDNYPMVGQAQHWQGRSFSFDPQQLIGNRPAKERLSLGAWYAHPLRAFLNLIGIK